MDLEFLALFRKIGNKLNLERIEIIKGHSFDAEFEYSISDTLYEVFSLRKDVDELKLQVDNLSTQQQLISKSKK